MIARFRTHSCQLCSQPFFEREWGQLSYGYCHYLVCEGGGGLLCEFCDYFGM
jgi:hypothetical protein